MRLVVVNYA